MFGEFTLFADLPRTHNAEAFGETVVDQIPLSDFNMMVQEYPEIKDYLLSALAQYLHIALETLDDVRRQPIIVRVAKVLLSYVHKHKIDMNIPITQTMMSETLGVSRLSVHNALKEFQKMNILERKYGAVFIKDYDALVEWIADHEELASL